MPTKKNRKLKITLSPAIIDEVATYMGVDNDHAIKLIGKQVHHILKYADMNEDKIYWSSIDTKALCTILENRLLINSNADIMLNNLSAYENWINGENFSQTEMLVIDRAFYILSHFFQKRTIVGFTRDIEHIVSNYELDQFNMILRLIDVALAYIHCDSDKLDVFGKYVYQAVVCAIENTRKKIQDVIENRLEFCKTKITELRDLKFKPQTVEEVVAVKTKKKRRHRKSKKNVIEINTPVDIIDTCDEKKDVK